MIGKTISHYEIRSKLGAGGMGVVYRAWDTTLERDVALKFLPADVAGDEAARKRFLREARAAAALDHPNICTVHEVGESDGHAFIVMRYVEGESLREKLSAGPVPLGEALDMVAQIARGLSAAHKSGIFHRDIKPANVLLTPDSRAKIVDFGLAKLTTGTNLTQTGTMLGTVAYMSPEQAEGGGEMDGRTDVWSLGVVLYEMLAGRRPFDAGADQATLYSILNTNAEPVSSVNPDIPLEVERVIERALEKDASRRYSSIDEFLADIEDLQGRQEGLGGAHPLRRWISHHRRQLAAGIMAAAGIAVVALAVWQFGPGRAGAIDSIAVLPFENLSPGGEHDLNADGVVVQLISHLLGIEALEKVSARGSVMRYKDTDKSLTAIGSELGVKGLVEGTYQQDGDRILITADLVDARDERVIWSQSFRGRLTDELSLQSQIARAIAEEIEVTLSPEEEAMLVVEREVDPEAYLQYLLGGEAWGTFGAGNWKAVDEAIRHYADAVEIDSTYVEAWASMAGMYSFKCQWVDEDETTSCRLAREYALKAISLGDNSAAAHAALAGVYFSVDHDWDAADREYRRAQDIDPAEAVVEYGVFLMWAGRFDEAVEIARGAGERDPLSDFVGAQLGFVLMSARRTNEAIAHYESMLERFPDSDILEHQLSWCYFDVGRFEEGIALRESYGGEVRTSEKAKMGLREEVEGLLADAKSKYEAGAYHFALIYCALGDEATGDLDSAMVYLEKAYEIQPEDLLQINSDPEFDILRPDPRFQALMERAGIPAGDLEYLYN